MSNIFVSDVMTREPITIGPNINLLECAKRMVRKRTGSLLIAEKEHLLGIISEYDILWALIKKSKNDLSKIKAIEISPKKIATIKPSATIDEAFRKMKKLKFERLPVIKDRELVGLITAKDILNFHPELYPELDELAKIREETRKLKMVKGKEIRSTHEGICEECGNEDILFRVNGMMLCESCKENMS